MKRIRMILTLLTILSVGGGGYYAYNRIQTKDINPPELKSSEDQIEVSIHATDEELKSTITATDPEEGDVSDSILIEKILMHPEHDDSENLFQIVYAAFDSAGNSSELGVDLSFTDYMSPHFILSRPLSFTEGEDINLLEYFSAKDVLDGDITPFITVEGADKFSENPSAGVYSCTINVTNSVGDTAVLPVKVYIAEASYISSMKPVIELTDYLLYIKQGSYFEPVSYLDHIQDNGYCQIDYGEMVPKTDDAGRPVLDKDGQPVLITEEVANGSKEKWVNVSQIQTRGYVDTSKKGTYTVQYTYTSGSTEYTTDTTLIVVVE